MSEKRLENVNTESGYVSVWFDSYNKKPISVLFYPNEDRDEFVEIVLEELPQLMQAIEEVTK